MRFEECPILSILSAYEYLFQDGQAHVALLWGFPYRKIKPSFLFKSTNSQHKDPLN